MEIIRLGLQIGSVAVRMGEHHLYRSGKIQISIVAMRELYLLLCCCHVVGDNSIICCEDPSTDVEERRQSQIKKNIRLSAQNQA